MLPTSIAKVCDLHFEALGKTSLSIIKGNFMFEVHEKLLSGLLLHFGLGFFHFFFLNFLFLLFLLLLLVGLDDMQFLFPVLLKFFEFLLEGSLVVLGQFFRFELVCQFLDP
jgi:hypothetical protein